MRTLPLFLNPTGRLCLVVGGGRVGMRKAHAVLDAGAAVRLVALEPPPDDPPENLTWLLEPYRREHLDGVSLTFAAATAGVNAQVVADAKARNIWVNSATDPAASDFLLPAVARKGRIELAVGSGGASPTAAALLRDRFAEQLDEVTTAWVDILSEMRDEVLERVPEPRRRELLRRLGHAAWLYRVRSQGPAVVREAMRAVVEKEANR